MTTDRRPSREIDGKSRAVTEQPATTLRRFKPYPAYKDSGVEWLGEVPERREELPDEPETVAGEAEP